MTRSSSLRSTTLNFILTNIMTTDEILNHVYECISVIPYGTNDPGRRLSCPVAWPTRRYVLLTTHPEQSPRRTTFSSKKKIVPSPKKNCPFSGSRIKKKTRTWGGDVTLQPWWMRPYRFKILFFCLFAENKKERKPRVQNVTLKLWWV
jgi:hypothetical protein